MASDLGASVRSASSCRKAILVLVVDDVRISLAFNYP
jgi:hypothetical protein